MSEMPVACGQNQRLLISNILYTKGTQNWNSDTYIYSMRKPLVSRSAASRVW